MTETGKASAALWGVTALSLAAAVAGGMEAWWAGEKVEEFALRCESLMRENDELRDRLAKAGMNVTIRVESVAGQAVTRSERNRSYLNVKALESGELWKGQIGTDSEGHAIFSDPAYSVRAGAIVLRNYERRHGIRTLRALVGRFAEGNREEYVRHLCRSLRLGPDETFSITARLPELLRAMVKFETGRDLARAHLEMAKEVAG